MEICKSRRSMNSEWWCPSDTHLSCLGHAQSECMRCPLGHASVPPYDTAWTGGAFELQASAICDGALCSVLQDKGEGLTGDLVVSRKNQNVSISANDEYKDRVSMASNASLLLSAAKLTDQRTFTCMVVSGADITEYPVNVVIYSESKIPFHIPPYAASPLVEVLMWQQHVDTNLLK